MRYVGTEGALDAAQQPTGATKYTASTVGTSRGLLRIELSDPGAGQLGRCDPLKFSQWRKGKLLCYWGKSLWPGSISACVPIRLPCVPSPARCSWWFVGAAGEAAGAGAGEDAGLMEWNADQEVNYGGT